MPGHLFTDYFLTDGIRDTDEWRESVSSGEEFSEFRESIRERYGEVRLYHEPNESLTEDDLIFPVLELLGWADTLPHQGTLEGEDIPDLLLFSDPESRRRAASSPDVQQRYRDAVAVGEHKRFGLALDARDEDGTGRARTPHGQILRYLSTADIVSDGRVRWGVLTSGDVWRLYDHRTRPRASGYFEVDLNDVLEAGDEDALRTFYLLFRRDSFVPRDGAVTPFLASALAEGRRYEQRVAGDISDTVFEKVFPSLVEALARDTGEDLGTVREEALIFLYRLLFILYAEDRALLPVNDTRYERYGLRKPVREDVANRMSAGSVFSDRADSYYSHVMRLFSLIDEGDASIGLPPYNGGLFSRDTAPMLESARLTDATIAPLIYDLSHTEEEEGRRRFVNYRDMSVQQLGSIYERLLERQPVRSDDGGIEVRPNTYARKDSGSFFTPQELVDIIVERTLKPLADERLEVFKNRSAELSVDDRPVSERLDELVEVDPAEAVLELKVLDPAMGSGHFLVTAVDFMSDYIADMVEDAPSVPDWLEGEYVSPLVARIAAIKEGIVDRSRESAWTLDESQLTDQAIIRRMVLKRCIYGVDKNPLTVELAKVSLWLHSFTVGAPLSFLDHHLRCGDSLVGLRVNEAMDELTRLAGLSASSAITGAESAAADMKRIEEMSDADVAEVRESASLFQDVEDTTAEVRDLFDFLCGLRWLTAGMKKRATVNYESPLVDILNRRPRDTHRLLVQGPDDNQSDGEDGESWFGFRDLWSEARSIANRERFLHWQVAFPGVWHDWNDASPGGGFDAVIGNPPWDRIKLQEVEWFANRLPRLALATTAAERRAGIRALRDAGDPLADDFDDAKERADKLGLLIRASGHYPLLGGGDINLYSLFVERAMSLVKPDGFVGLLTPSGIYADKTAAKFFKSLSTGGRVSSLFDFENRKIFFKDVHASFKFCALVFGGSERRFDSTECAFFLHDTNTVRDPDRCFPLAPDDFARVNPNTGTAPVFRTRRAAEITRRIYESHPVLVDRSGDDERRAWPVGYKRMFDMTNDSHLFRTSAQLEGMGFIRVDGNRWKKAEELYLPLYQGRMIGQFDHRANSVRVNPDNVHNPYLSEEVSEDEHADPRFLPQSHYWVPASDVESEVPERTGYSLGFRDIARSTDVRTMIAAIAPWAGYGNTLPLLVSSGGFLSAENLALMVANLNSLCVDFVVRQKAQGTHLNWYIVEQLPFIGFSDYERQFGETTARELVRDHVLRLTYTAHDMKSFAKDLGYAGEPFIWDEEDRRHLRARLDALHFHLYGLSRGDAAYVLDTFPIVRGEDEAAFDRYRTKEMVLEYMNALTSGDIEARVRV